MKVIGLTGGIGTGKSTAAAYLKRRGFAHIDADEISRGITAAGSDMLPALNKVFGPDGPCGEKGREILNDDGSLNRKALASLVFTDSRKKARLDDMMFREIIAEIDRQIAAYRNDEDGTYAGILLDAPLLFEAGLDSRCDQVVVLVADEAVRIERVCSRDSVGKQDVRNRINSQMKDEDKRKKADFIVDNSRGLDELKARLEELIEKLSVVENEIS